MDPLAAAKAAPANGPIAASGPQDPTDTLRSASLRNLLTLLAIWNLFEFVAGIPLLSGNKPAAYVRVLASTVLMVAIPFWLERRGRNKAACWMFVLSGSLAASVSQALAGGIRSPATVLQLAVAVAAILLLGKAGGVVATMFFLAADSGLVAYQYAGGRLPEVFFASPLGTWALMVYAFLIAAPPLWLAVQRLHDDLAEAKVSEAHLRFTTAQLTEAQILNRSGNFLYDVAERSSMWSPGVFRILGVPAPAAVEPWMFRPTQRTVRDFVPPEDQYMVDESFSRLLEGDPQEVAHPVRRPDGETRHVRVRLIPEADATGRVTHIRGTLQDETEQHNYEMERRRILDELRQLTVFQEKVREEERQRIARLVHDELGQQLVGLKMRTGYAAQLAESGSVATMGEIDVIAKQLESAIRTVRDIATHLRPEVLDRFGLVPALAWLARQFTENNRIPCATAFQATAAAGDTAIVVYRAAQEALTNVAKHARATQVELSLFADRETIELEISDNGRGFDPADVAPTSFGLAGIRERAVNAGGSFTISRGEEGGTVLRLVLPLTESVRRN
ncbi:MAG TPA: histidine kinase [Bryobacteraceae bacterium]|nr:histidine kinase [Bryobacteraceae bacterium]